MSCEALDSVDIHSLPARLHVLQDVLPYTCVFEKCSTPYQSYSSATKWLAHMEQEHSGRQWTCYGCSPFQPRIFDNHGDYVEHFGNTRQHAGITTQAQIEKLAQLDETPRPLNFKTCPLCRWSENSELNSFIPTTMQDHIADHMVSFAMWSLPSDDDLDCGSELGIGSSNQAVNSETELSIDIDSSFPSDSQREIMEDSAEVMAPQTPGVEYPAMRSGLTDRTTTSSHARKNSSSGLPMLRWRKLILLSTTVVSFLAAGRRFRSKFLCPHCLVISEFFEDLNVRDIYKLFDYHPTRTAMYMWARLECSLCKIFFKTAFGEPEESDYDALESEGQEDESTSFYIAYSGQNGNKSLELWDRQTSTVGKLLCTFEIYCSRCK
jgi:hypothetical protein